VELPIGSDPLAADDLGAELEALLKVHVDVLSTRVARPEVLEQALRCGSRVSTQGHSRADVWLLRDILNSSNRIISISTSGTRFATTILTRQYHQVDDEIVNGILEQHLPSRIPTCRRLLEGLETRRRCVAWSGNSSSEVDAGPDCRHSYAVRSAHFVNWRVPRRRLRRRSRNRLGKVCLRRRRSPASHRCRWPRHIRLTLLG
jgi:hypothetical protein